VVVLKKIVDDLRTIYKCCSLYYEDNKSQQEVCDYLKISRASLSRMLKAGRDQGIVNIEVVNPVKYSYGELEKEIEKEFGLKEIIVVHNSVLDSQGDLVTYLSEEASLFLNQIFEDGDCIGVSMGHTMHNITKVEKNFDKERDLLFVPLMGGISQSKVRREDIQSNQIAAKFTQLFGGRYLQFLSPAVFSNHEVLDGFLQETAINYIFDYYRKLNTVVMGIGVPEREKSTLVSAGYINEEYMDRMLEQGLAGDIALHFFDEEGNLEPFEEFNNRVASISMKQLKKVRNRIAVVSGAEKANAVKAAIKGGFVNILITDVTCAESLLQ